MPEAHRSFYSDMVYGSDYFTYVSRELPGICEQLFRVNHLREKTFIAGLSMGGYGALRCGLARPDLYRACAGFSGAVDPLALMPQMEQMGMAKQVTAILGTGMMFRDDANLFKLAGRAACLPKDEQPRVLVTCGESDSLLADNRRFDAHMKSLEIPFEYKEWPGDHDWKFWEESLEPMFEFFEKEIQQ